MSKRAYAHLILQPLAWALLVAVGAWYAQDREVPPHVAMAILPAFLVELGLYFAAASERLRSGFAALPKARAAAFMTLAAVPSYLIYTIATGTFQVWPLAAIAGLVAAASFWYVVAGRSGTADAGFLVLLAIPVLFRFFEHLYPDVAGRIPMSSLGKIMWFRTGLLAMLAIREVQGVGFGLLPRRSEWAIGIRNFGLFLPLGIGLAMAIDFVRPSPPELTPRLLLVAALYFVGTLWFLAVAEEFFFRGLLQQMLARALNSTMGGLVTASILFGLVHLGFRQFPNWRMALLAAVAGIFYGRAFLQAASIRAAMVTHALVVTLWRVFLV